MHRRSGKFLYNDEKNWTLRFFILLFLKIIIFLLLVRIVIGLSNFLFVLTHLC